MSDAAELAAVTGRIIAILAWLTENPGDCLADQPAMLATAREMLARLRELTA